MWGSVCVVELIINSCMKHLRYIYVYHSRMIEVHVGGQGCMGISKSSGWEGMSKGLGDEQGLRETSEGWGGSISNRVRGIQ